MLSGESIMALADSGTALCVKLYWFLHASGSEARITLARVALLKGMFQNSVEVTALGLFLMVGINPTYLLRTSIQTTCWPMVYLTGFLTWHIK